MMSKQPSLDQHLITFFRTPGTLFQLVLFSCITAQALLVGSFYVSVLLHTFLLAQTAGTPQMIPLSQGSTGAVLQTQTVVISLENRQEVPPVETNAFGSGEVMIDTEKNMLSYDLVYEGLSSTEEAAHIHGMAEPGAEADVLATLAIPIDNGDGTWTRRGLWEYDESQEADILAGLTYINIHTQLYPDGELRAQIAPEIIPEHPLASTPTLPVTMIDELVPADDVQENQALSRFKQYLVELLSRNGVRREPGIINFVQSIWHGIRGAIREEFPKEMVTPSITPLVTEPTAEIEHFE